MTDILSQLKHLGVTLGMPDQPKKAAQPDQNSVDNLIKVFPNAIVGENFYGPYFNNRIIHPLSERHGIVSLNDPFSPNEKLNLLLNTIISDHRQTLAMDTETSGLSSIASGFVFMIGLGYFTDDAYIIDQLILPDLSYEKAFLAQIGAIFAKFKTILTYNGLSFDIPMIRSRIRFNALPDFCKEIDHLDFLPIVRRFWRGSLENCRLSTVERDLLQIQRGEEEVPGYLAPEYYREFLRSGKAETLSGVAYHNQIDVLSLSAFLLYLSDLAQKDLRDAGIRETHKISHQNFLKHTLKTSLAVDHTAFLCQGYPQPMRRKAARQFLTRGETEKAEAIYLALFDEGDYDSCLALVSFYQKKRETIHIAVDLLEKCLDQLSSDETLGIWSKKEKSEKLTRQINKLNQKIGDRNDRKI